jgi:hypothetical protein
MKLVKKVEPQQVLKAITDISGFTSEDLSSDVRFQRVWYTTEDNR